jgi:hypothetical protein
LAIGVSQIHFLWIARVAHAAITAHQVGSSVVLPPMSPYFLAAGIWPETNQSVSFAHYGRMTPLPRSERVLSGLRIAVAGPKSLEETWIPFLTSIEANLVTSSDDLANCDCVLVNGRISIPSSNSSWARMVNAAKARNIPLVDHVWLKRTLISQYQLPLSIYGTDEQN